MTVMDPHHVMGTIFAISALLFFLINPQSQKHMLLLQFLNRWGVEEDLYKALRTLPSCHLFHPMTDSHVQKE